MSIPPHAPARSRYRPVRMRTVGFAVSAVAVALLGVAAIVWYANRAYRPLSVWEVRACGRTLSCANALELVTEALAPGPPGAWDERIREIGNVVFNPTGEEWLFFYSGCPANYNDHNVYIGLAVSRDGRTFTKEGRVLEAPSEDPYVVFDAGTFYMFYEDKSEAPFRKIDLARSSDGRQWEIVRRGIIEPRGDSWQNQDVSSPVVTRTATGWIMFYEGRGRTSRGRIGAATAENLLGEWDQPDDFVLGGDGSWDHNVVPDDIISDENGGYILLYHGKPARSRLAERLANRSRIWQSGLAHSTDLHVWRRIGDRPISSSTTLTTFRTGSELFLLVEPVWPAPQHHAGVEVHRPVHVEAVIRGDW